MVTSHESDGGPPEPVVLEDGILRAPTAELPDGIDSDVQGVELNNVTVEGYTSTTTRR